MPVSADEALWRALSDLGLVTDHLREKNKGDLANMIAKATNDVVNAFYQAELFGDDLKFSPSLKTGYKARMGAAITSAAAAAAAAEDRNCDGSNNMTSYASDIGAQKGAEDRNTTRDRSGTWAAVVAVSSGVSNQFAKYRQDSMNGQLSLNARAPIFSPRSSSPIDSVTPSVFEQAQALRERGIMSGYLTSPTEMERKARVIWVTGLPDSFTSLSVISSKITTGPLNGMAWRKEGQAWVVIFMFSAHADTFLAINERVVRETGSCVYGPGCKVEPGQQVKWTDDIERMEPPTRERRRLTFVKGKHDIFETDQKRKKFEAEILKVAGPHNVEVIWMFNIGNVTAIFATVPVARHVREHFNKRSQERNGYWEGIKATYSTDPCEKAVILQTQVPGYLEHACRQPHLRHLALRPAKPAAAAGSTAAAYKMYLDTKLDPINKTSLSIAPTIAPASGGVRKIFPSSSSSSATATATNMTSGVHSAPASQTQIVIPGSGHIPVGPKKWQTVGSSRRRK